MYVDPDLYELPEYIHLYDNHIELICTHTPGLVRAFNKTLSLT